MKRSTHNLSHQVVTTNDNGVLMPIGCVEVLPGDTFRHSVSMLLRTIPLVSPLMHGIDLRVHSFFVPNRIMWDGWEDYISKQTGTHPTITYTEGTSDYSLLNSLGVPPRGVAAETHILNAFPIRAYNHIYNEFYRDQDIQAELNVDQLELQRVCWAKDNFTTARTYPQYGATGISIPFASGNIDVKSDVTTPGNHIGIYSTDDSDHVQLYADGGDSSILADTTTTNAEGGKLYVTPNEHSGIDINDYRQARAFQRFLENRNKFGSRYVDYLRALGVRPRDGRLSRPEYLGGGKQTISFSEVLATSDSGTFTVGDIAGHGLAALRTRPYNRFFEEHGIMLTLLSTRPKTIYQSGKHRLWERQEGTSADLQYWEKEHEALGPQRVYDFELYGDQDSGEANHTTFGYNDRHYEYRKMPSYATNGCRDGGDYEDWTLSREFAAAPVLNTSFLECTPSDRAFANTTTPELQAMVNHRLKARRLVSKYARF